MIIKMNLIVGVALILAQITFIKAEDLKELMTGKLINSIAANNYSTFLDLFNRVDINDPTNFNEIIREVLKYEFNKINLEKLVNFFKTHENKEQSVFGYSAVFDELKNRNKLNGNEVLVTLAFGLKDLLKGNLSSKSSAEGNRLKDALPESVKNLAFASQVCIRNYEYNEYMYAASDGFNYDGSRRTIFSWIPGGKVVQGNWIIEPFNDRYHIRNVDHNEYLYTPNWWYNFDYYVMRQFTWIPGGTDGDEKFEYTFVPYEDKVEIKNTYYNQSVFATILTWDPDRRLVAAYPYDLFDVLMSSLWVIEDCS